MSWSRDVSSRFGYAVMCDRKRPYAVRCGKYAAKSAGVSCACCDDACLGMTLHNASPTLDLGGKGITGTGDVAGPCDLAAIQCSALLNLAVLRSRRRLRRRVRRSPRRALPWEARPARPRRPTDTNIAQRPNPAGQSD